MPFWSFAADYPLFILISKDQESIAICNISTKGNPAKIGEKIQAVKHLEALILKYHSLELNSIKIYCGLEEYWPNRIGIKTEYKVT